MQRHIRAFISLKAFKFPIHYTPQLNNITTRGYPTNRNPFDFETDSVADVSAAAFGIDEYSKQQQRNKGDAVEEAKTAALKLLSARSHSRKELKQKLSDRGHEMGPIIEALDRLQKVGLQSDREFAEVFCRSKWRQTKWGPSRIKTELLHRGVTPEDVIHAIHLVFNDGISMKRYLELQYKEDTSGDGSPELQSPEAALLSAAKREYERSRGLAGEARRRRLAAWLQRRGHQWDDVRRIVQVVEEEEKELYADEGGE